MLNSDKSVSLQHTSSRENRNTALSLLFLLTQRFQVHRRESDMRSLFKYRVTRRNCIYSPIKKNADGPSLVVRDVNKPRVRLGSRLPEYISLDLCIYIVWLLDKYLHQVPGDIQSNNKQT